MTVRKGMPDLPLGPILRVLCDVRRVPVDSFVPDFPPVPIDEELSEVPRMVVMLIGPTPKDML